MAWGPTRVSRRRSRGTGTDSGRESGNAIILNGSTSSQRELIQTRFAVSLVSRLAANDISAVCLAAILLHLTWQSVFD